MFSKFLAASIIAICIPKQIPKKGILFNLAYFMAAIFPSLPLFPKPPGIKIPETSFKADFKFWLFKCFESILLRLTLRLFAIPPWVKASSKDLYASLRLTYFPIIPIFTSFVAFNTFVVMFFHFVRFGIFLLLILKSDRTLSSSFSL